MLNWFAKMFKKEEEPQIVYKCPKCGSTDINNYTILKNFESVIANSEVPLYNQVVTCSNCGYRVISGPDEDAYAQFSEEVVCQN